MMEPSSFEEAVKYDECMKVEIKMIKKNQSWNLVDKPNEKKDIGVKLVYRLKLNLDGSINKHKARLVVKGYSQ